MDYSLLVIVETNPAFIEANKKRAMKKKNTVTQQNEFQMSPTLSRKQTLGMSVDRKNTIGSTVETSDMPNFEQL